MREKSWAVCILIHNICLQVCVLSAGNIVNRKLFFGFFLFGRRFPVLSKCSHHFIYCSCDIIVQKRMGHILKNTVISYLCEDRMIVDEDHLTFTLPCKCEGNF